MKKGTLFIAFNLLCFHAINFASNQKIHDIEYSRAVQRQHECKIFLRENQADYFIIRTIRKDILLNIGSTGHEYSGTDQVVKKSFCQKKQQYRIHLVHSHYIYKTQGIIFDENIENGEYDTFPYAPCDCKHCIKPNSHSCIVN